MLIAGRILLVFSFGLLLGATVGLTWQLLVLYILFTAHGALAKVEAYKDLDGLYDSNIPRDFN
jgi:hypothetical protein